MNVLFILYHGMDCNSAHHVAGLAKCLAAQGDRCAVAVPDAHATPPGALPLAWQGYLREVRHGDVGSGGAVFEGNEVPEVVVAWTPRENVRAVVARALRRWRVPLVVHLEDNEDAITARYLGVPVAAVGRASCWTLRKIRGLAISHPRRMRALLARASGVSMVMDRLAEFCPAGVPAAVFWPGYDDALFDRAEVPFPRERRAEVLRRWGVDEQAVVLVYTGNIHCGNVDDMETLYRTVIALNRRGVTARLLRTGETHVPEFLGNVAEAAPFVAELGFLPRGELPALLAAADVLVQPGPPGVFNDYRFPSKVPEYLVSGRPLVVAKTNVGRFLRDGVEAVVVPQGTVEELAEAVVRLHGDRAAGRAIGRAGREFARRNLRWDAAARKFRELLVEARARRLRRR